VDAQILWQLAISLPASLVRGPAGELMEGLEDQVADLFGANGDVEIGPDIGRVDSGDDAARFAVETLGPGPAPGALATTAAAARGGFDRGGEALGRLRPPAESLLDRLGDLPTPDPSTRRGR
jgi:hypothetical protein